MDSRERPSWGVGAFAEPVGDKIRVILDDLQRVDGQSELPRWEMWAFVTYRDCDPTAFFTHKLTPEDYESLGRTVMARLVAQLQVHGADRGQTR